MKIETTLNAIRAHSPCEDGWVKLLAHLGKMRADDAPVPFLTILESNGLDDAIWCLRVLPESYRKFIAGLACDFAERTLKFVPAGEDRPAMAIATTRAWVRGEATLDEVKSAANADAAAYAARAAYAADAAAYAAAYAAGTAARTAANAYAATGAAARPAARAAEKKAQIEIFIAAIAKAKEETP